MNVWYRRSTVRFLCFMVLFCEHSSDATSVKHFKAEASQVLLFSVGGFRQDYVRKLKLPNIESMISHGTKVNYVENSLNVLDVVDYTSVVTGLYPESHGIISNIMYDPILDRVFNKRTRDDPAWWKRVHPAWQDVQRNGWSSALCHWPGVYGEMKPELHCGERQNVTADVKQAIVWLHSNVKLVLLHTDVIKQAALRWGPYSPKTIHEVRHVDAIVKNVLEQTRDLNVDILLMSDSGVTEVNNRVVNLDDCLNPRSYVLPQVQGTLLFYPKRGFTVKEVYQNLTRCRHLKVYLKDELAERYHFKNNPRIPPIIAFVALGTRVTSSKHLGSQAYNKGGEGYHPGYEVMRGMLIAYGPSFPQGLNFPAIGNVDIYPLMCRLLKITPRPNNGSYDRIKSMMNDDVPLSDDVIASDVTTSIVISTTIPVSRQIWIKEDVKWLFWILVGITGLLIVFCFLGCIATMYMNHQNGEFRKTRVDEPAMTSLLTDDSSDEE